MDHRVINLTTVKRWWTSRWKQVWNGIQPGFSHTCLSVSHSNRNFQNFNLHLSQNVFNVLHSFTQTRNDVTEQIRTSKVRGGWGIWSWEMEAGFCRLRFSGFRAAVDHVSFRPSTWARPLSSPALPRNNQHVSAFALPLSAAVVFKLTEMRSSPAPLPSKVTFKIKRQTSASLKRHVLLCSAVLCFYLEGQTLQFPFHSGNLTQLRDRNKHLLLRDASWSLHINDWNYKFRNDQVAWSSWQKTVFVTIFPNILHHLYGW